MKSPLDPRHKHRENLVQQLFAWEFTKKIFPKQHELKTITANLKKIDSAISKAAPQWELNKIAKVDLAILRLAVYELLVQKKEPYKVIIDEAVELGKKYGNDKSSVFINGVLGTINNTK